VKITCLVSMLIGSAVLTPETTYAVPSNRARASHQSSSETSASTVGDHGLHAKHHVPGDTEKRQNDRSPSGEQRNQRTDSGKNQPRNLTTTPKAHLNQLSSSRERSLSGNALSVHHPSSSNSSSAVKAGIIQPEPAKTAVPHGLQSFVQPSVPSLANVRHRGANPAIIGGSAKSGSRNAGAINGTRMQRRP
jgi:hypothetical protein